MTSMIHGTVRFYNHQKGFGLVTPDVGGEDVFVRATALECAGIGTLTNGQKVRFEIEADRWTKGATVGKIEVA